MNVSWSPLCGSHARVASGRQRPISRLHAFRAALWSLFHRCDISRDHSAERVTVDRQPMRELCSCGPRYAHAASSQGSSVAPGGVTADSTTGTPEPAAPRTAPGASHAPRRSRKSRRSASCTTDRASRARTARSGAVICGAQPGGNACTTRPTPRTTRRPALRTRAVVFAG